MHWALYGYNGHRYPPFPSRETLNISTIAEVLGGFLLIDRHSGPLDVGPLLTADLMG